MLQKILTISLNDLYNFDSLNKIFSDLHRFFSKIVLHELEMKLWLERIKKNIIKNNSKIKITL